MLEIRKIDCNFIYKVLDVQDVIRNEFEIDPLISSIFFVLLVLVLSTSALLR